MNNNFILVTNAVMPSQRLIDDKHLLWVLFDESGNIITDCRLFSDKTANSCELHMLK